MTLSRKDFENGRFARTVAKGHRLGLFKPRPEEEWNRTRHDAIAAFAGGDAWIFGYGSLMWNPAIEFEERRPAKIHGYHRRFCLSTPLGRGTPELPGLVLGLVPGGSCQGVAFRIPADKIAVEMELIWKREMLGRGYHWRIVPMRTPQGPARGVTFVVNRDYERFTGMIPMDDKAHRLAFAEGELGPCREYLFNAVKALDEWGIHDRYLADLARMVRERRES
jgi:cation transport protein ChaC